MNSWFVSDGKTDKLYDHPDTTQYYFEKNNSNKALVFVPQVLIDSGEVDTDRIVDMRSEQISLEKFLATDVLYLVDSKVYPYSYLSNLFVEYEGKPRNYFVLLSERV